jgi:hypothetical protein
MAATAAESCPEDRYSAGLAAWKIGSDNGTAFGGEALGAPLSILRKLPSLGTGLDVAMIPKIRPCRVNAKEPGPAFTQPGLARSPRKPTRPQRNGFLAEPLLRGCAPGLPQTVRPSTRKKSTEDWLRRRTGAIPPWATTDAAHTSAMSLWIRLAPGQHTRDPSP